MGSVVATNTGIEYAYTGLSPVGGEKVNLFGQHITNIGWQPELHAGRC
jgi:hypothetical protein